MKRILNTLTKLTEDMKGVWALLNSTAVYLETGEMFEEYELMFQIWRKLLLINRNNADVFKEVRADIIQFRKALRNDGHDLRMSGKDLRITGFKSDDCIKYGYKRAVLYIGPKRISYLTGHENHIDLAERFFRLNEHTDEKSYNNLHYIWFRWHENFLDIAGSDTETKENFEILTNIIRRKKMIVLSMLKDIY